MLQSLFLFVFEKIVKTQQSILMTTQELCKAEETWMSSEQIPAGKMDLNDIHNDPYHG